MIRDDFSTEHLHNLDHRCTDERRLFILGCWRKNRKRAIESAIKNVNEKGPNEGSHWSSHRVGTNDAINVELRSLTKGSLDPSPQKFPTKAANCLNTNKTDPCAIKLGRSFFELIKM